jgi:hypothetical protein
MSVIGCRAARTLRYLLLLAIACLGPELARAESTSLPYFIVVQPIDVCSSTGTGCAPINSKGQTVLNGTTTPVGFFDPTSGANITQAIWNQIGVNVVFQPVVQYNSAANVSPTGAYAATDFRTLHVVASTQTATGLTSPDFLVLSQQPQISQIPLTPAGQTPYKPTAPLSPSPTTINMFFVNTLVPPTPGQLYGFTWLGNNGVAISANTMTGVALLGLPPRPDTFAHELGHALGLDHTTFGAGPNASGVCGLTCTANLMTAGGTAGMNLRTEPTIACVLMNPPSSTCASQSLIDETADQLNTEAQQGPSLAVSQQMEVLGSGFINAIPNSMLTVTTAGSGGASPDAATADTQSTAGGKSGAGSQSGAGSSVVFSLSGPQPPPPEAVDVLVIMLPSGLKFDSKNPFKIISESRKTLVSDVDYYPDADNNPNNPSGIYKIGTPAYTACTATGAQCLIVEFNPPGLGASDYIQFSQGILSNGAPATLQQLAGAGITFVLSNASPAGTVTTSQYITTTDLVFNGSNADTASTQSASTTVPPQINNPSAFAGGGQVPCTPFYDANGNLTCLNPVQTGITDGDPNSEGGQ